MSHENFDTNTAGTWIFYPENPAENISVFKH
jgi:hypothetical protein